MGLLACLESRSIVNDGGSLRNPPIWLQKLFGLDEESNQVTETTALQLSAVWAAVRVIAETTASLPFGVYERLAPRGRREIEDHSATRLLHERPNEFMTPIVFRETLLSHVLLWGNAWARIKRDGGGRPLAAYPLLPDRTRTVINDAGRMMHVTDEDGIQRAYSDEDVLYVPGLGFDGLRGYSVIKMAANSMSLTSMAERFGRRFFTSDARPSVVVKHPHKFPTPEARENFVEGWRKRHSGPKAWSMALVEEGMDVMTLTIPPEDAQFLETRRFQISEIARWYRVPPHMLGDLERATFTNIEHQGIDFVTHTLRSWATRFEQAVDAKLLAPSERGRLFSRHNMDALLRGDLTARYNAYHVGLQDGFLSLDDVREREDMNPIPGGAGAIYMRPLNMTPAVADPEAADELKFKREIARLLVGGEGGDIVDIEELIAQVGLPVDASAGGMLPEGGESDDDDGGGMPRAAARAARLAFASAAARIEERFRRSEEKAQRQGKGPAWYAEYCERHAAETVELLVPACEGYVLLARAAKIRADASAPRRLAAALAARFAAWARAKGERT